jgi:hypothetical protein
MEGGASLARPESAERASPDALSEPAANAARAVGSESTTVTKSKDRANWRIVGKARLPWVEIVISSLVVTIDVILLFLSKTI